MKFLCEPDENSVNKYFLEIENVNKTSSMEEYMCEPSSYRIKKWKNSQKCKANKWYKLFDL